MIEVGDEIRSRLGEPSTVTSVEKGKLGLLLHINLNGNDGYRVYCPWELAPPEIIKDRWYGWARYDYLLLSDNFKIGGICCYWQELDGLVDFEEKWQRTIEQIRAEEIKEEEASL